LPTEGPHTACPPTGCTPTRSRGLFARTAHGGRRSTLSGRELDLTATEHDLLCALARNAGGVRSYDDLVDPNTVKKAVRGLTQPSFGRERHRREDRRMSVVGERIRARARSSFSRSTDSPVHSFTRNMREGLLARG